MLTTDNKKSQKADPRKVGFLIVIHYFGTVPVLIEQNRNVSVFIKLYIGTIFSEYRNFKFSELFSAKSN